MQLKGYWAAIKVREGNDWKIRMLTTNVTPTPALTQQKDTITDPQIVEQLHAIGKKSDEAFLKGDAAARAALFTEDAVYVEADRSNLRSAGH
jgi:hypothetical protein